MANSAKIAPTGSFANWMGWRYLFAGTSGYSSFVNWVSVVGLALGVMLFIVISSVHNGLQVITLERLLKTTPHATIAPEFDTTELLDRLDAESNVLEVVDHFEEFVLIQRPGDTDGRVLIGHQGYATQQLQEALVSGNAADINKGLLISDTMAGLLSIGDPVMLVLVSPENGHLRPRFHRVPIVGTFKFNSQADYSNAFVSLAKLKELGLLDPSKHGKRVFLQDPIEIETLAEKYPELQTWSETYRELFRVYQLEKIVLYCLMFLVVVLASFNIVSGQAMLVNSKRSDIAIMTTMGSTHGFMVRVLAIQGMLVALFGIIAGVVLGVLIANYVGPIFDMFDEALGIPLLQDSPFSSLPAKVFVTDVVIGVVITALLSGYAVLHPVWRLLNMDPVEELS